MTDDFYQLQKHAPSPEELIAGAGKNFVVLTAFERQRRAINRQWAQMHGASDTAVPQLRVRTIESWTRDWWKTQRREYGGPTLLSPFAERLLWRNIISQWSRRENRPLPIGELAELARQAHRLCLLFAISPTDSKFDAAFDAAEDTRAFAQWQKQFFIDAQKINSLTLTEAAHRLADAPIAAAGAEQIYLTEEETRPLYQKLLQRFTVITQQPAAAAQHHQAHQILLPDIDAECEAAAHWLEQHLRQNPQAAVAVVANNIAEYRYPLRRAFARVLAPSTLTMQQRKQPLLSFGHNEPLAEEPRIAAALAVLNWNRRNIAGEEFFCALESGCWGANDGMAQARLQKHLRRNYHRATFTLGQIIKQCEYCAKNGGDGEHDLYLALDKFASLGGGNKAQTLSSWAKQFRHQLDAISWRGGDMAERLEELFHQLDCDSRKFGRQSLNTILSLITDEAVRAQQTDGGGLISALGPQEAASEPLDAVWLLGATDEQWPSSPAPNPLLPLSLQLEKNIPRSSVIQEWTAAESACRQLLGTAQSFVASAPKANGERECAMWSFFAELPDLPAQQNSPSRWTTWMKEAAPMVEQWMPGDAPAVNAAEENVRGGSRIIKDQQDCPFAAFAIHRLGAAPLETTSIGIAPIDWGTFIHRAMEIFWGGMKDWDALQSVAADPRQAAMTMALKQAFEELPGSRGFGARWRTMEMRRAEAALTAWLEKEDERQPFVVKETEAERTLTMAGLTLRLKIDRVDRGADDKLVIIDYKTGVKVPSSRVWGEPISEPQLPLYALTDDAIAAVAFGHVHSDGASFIDSSSIKDEKTWDERKAGWREELEQLAADFMAGKAAKMGGDNLYQQNGLRLLARHGYREELLR